jgi:hypothetical protein
MDDLEALMDILGPAAEQLVSDDRSADKRICRDFAAQAAQKVKLVAYAGRPAERTLLTGDQEWPLPIPIVQVSGNWYFATGATKLKHPMRTEISPYQQK